MKSLSKLLSKTKMKKKHIASPRISMDKVTILKMHSRWTKYMKGLLSSNLNQSQMQSRLQTAEIIGAGVIVVEAKASRKVGCVGIVSATSLNCIFISCLQKKTAKAEQVSEPCTIDSKEASSAENDTRAHNKSTDNAEDYTVNVVQLNRDDVVLGVILPSDQNNKSALQEDASTVFSLEGKKIGLLYGKNYFFQGGSPS